MGLGIFTRKIDFDPCCNSSGKRMAPCSPPCGFGGDMKWDGAGIWTQAMLAGMLSTVSVWLNPFGHVSKKLEGNP